MRTSRRTALKAAMVTPAGLWLAACADDVVGESPATTDESQAATNRWMPAEEAPHDATWMCMPARRDVWGRDLRDVQDTIASIALAIARFEPVRMLVHPDDMELAADLVGTDVERIEAPVDDLWARDTLPLFLVSDDSTLTAGRVRFNGWGDKQVHDGDTQLAAIVADILGVEFVDAGITGEGGGLETDGDGTLLAARSSWVNANRNPGVGEDELAATLVELLGAERLLWVDGIAGADITDGHIDTLARFTSPSTIVHEVPSYIEPGEVWYDLAQRTIEELDQFETLDGEPYELVQLRQPETTRRNDAEFLASYVNYYVCNGAVLVPEFGDATADALAAELIGEQYPDREIVTLDIDPVASGGGGIHCATQQQPQL